jgi:Tfp pilus assembly protein PilE
MVNGLSTAVACASGSSGSSFVIVIGVLVALAIDAGYQAVIDRSAEREALDALHADLMTTLERLDTAIEDQR